MSKKFWVVIPAAGVGRRMQSDCPKQYLDISGKTVLDRTISVFIERKDIEGIAVGIGANDAYWQDSIWAEHPNVHSYVGGSERSETVQNGLSFLLDQHGVTPHQSVLVHDAARPLLSQTALDKILSHDGKFGCILALPCRDTIKQQQQQGNATIHSTLDRRLLWQAQTPQCFPVGALKKALEQAVQDGALITDESSAMERLGWQPALIEGDVLNFKITSPDDLMLARAVLR
ncbi:2-C-methyl-D-erythritol 4-phosphate cytidylyltransferase [Marinomonas mediterranea]|uniref:2-C-methyl-D-erythritol 4-phosphate cytidylyltransferase n=1 Tax=Marinomonas mediterranea TaxID=119864 RepID=UPI00234A33DB|nr:2-C-methyl-D-erythritol 4-phosphate cytidylyltransferase [Marinomonas mediterranea]WCN12561.1 2-C-methyl-D-erythritol 4-phosphate cytidylyltransferase [Marinomonas mediterranea]